MFLDNSENFLFTVSNAFFTVKCLVLLDALLLDLLDGKYHVSILAKSNTVPPGDSFPGVKSPLRRM